MSITADPATAQLAGQLVVFTLANEEYALPIGKVQEIIRYTEPRSVDTGIHWLRGVISLRGKIIPVCDLAARLGLSHEQAESAKIMIVDTPAGTAGVIVDDVHEVLSVDADQLEPVPGTGTDFIQAIAKIDTRLVVLLCPERMLAGAEAAGA
jgi:purine-binding chemotaxis protein CheW